MRLNDLIHRAIFEVPERKSPLTVYFAAEPRATEAKAKDVFNATYPKTLITNANSTATALEMDT